jgi:hypothetical protein
MTTTEEKAVHITPCTDGQYMYPYIVSVGHPVNSVDDLHYWDEDTEPAVSMHEASKIAAKLRRKHKLGEIINHVGQVRE